VHIKSESTHALDFQSNQCERGSGRISTSGRNHDAHATSAGKSLVQPVARGEGEAVRAQAEGQRQMGKAIPAWRQMSGATRKTSAEK
jgi:DNA-binding IclR family transcriptional regulator